MLVLEALALHGGVATREALIGLTSRAEVDRAVDAGEIERTARGRLTSLGVGDARRAAHRITGTVCLLSAALHHEWPVKLEPEKPQVAVPRNRKVPTGYRDGVELFRLDLDADDVVDGVTSQDRTLVDCGRLLPEDEGLAVFDSALRSGFSHPRLVALARDARGPHVKQLRSLAARATHLAANPFESCTRSIADGVPGLSVRPQVPLYGSEFLGRPDLVDVDLRLVIESDSFEFHGERAAFTADTRRYNAFVVNGWLVVRFAWEDVMFDPEYVRSVLVALVAERTKVCRHCGSAA